MKAMKSVLFIDRDGVIVEETQVDSLEKIHFIPHVMEALREIRRNMREFLKFSEVRMSSLMIFSLITRSRRTTVRAASPAPACWVNSSVMSMIFPHPLSSATGPLT